MWQTVCLFLISIYVAGTHGAVTIIPSYATVIVAEGKTLQINCTSDSPGTLKWTKDGGQLETSGNLEIRGIADNGDNVSILTHSNVDASVQGTYRCTDESANEASVNVQIVQVDAKDALFEYQQGASISCTIQRSEPVTFSWKRNGTKVSDIPAPAGQKFQEHANGTLEFLPITTTREDAGVYECQMSVQLAGGENQQISASAVLYAKPMVIPFHQSKNLVQEERLDLRCKVLGFPHPNITWFMDGVEIKGDEEGSRFKLFEVDGFPNAQLKIESVDFDDGGEYKCVASAAHIMFDDKRAVPTAFNSSQVIVVRVKDKLAALWPFLGIVAEVVILCTIIFIYEKKRNKDAANDEAVNQDGATPKKSQEGVRHRGNTNNPRA